MGAVRPRGPSVRFSVSGAFLPHSGARSRCNERARWYRAVLSVKIDTRSASYSCAAQIRQAVSKARRHGAEQNLCGLPPLLRGSYSLPHHVHSRLTAPTARHASRRHGLAGWRRWLGRDSGAWSWAVFPADRRCSRTADTIWQFGIGLGGRQGIAAAPQRHVLGART